MPDHLHFFVALDEDVVTLSAFMKSLRTRYRKRCGRAASPHRIGRKASSSTSSVAPSHMPEKWQYVRDKPVRGGFTTSWEAWPFKGEVHTLDVRRS
jgi:REP element-mobilizing transposase RayT